MNAPARRTVLALAAVAGAVAVILLALHFPRRPGSDAAQVPALGLDRLLGTAPARTPAPSVAGDFARAVRPRPFSFPRDHGPHPAFRNEWWYFTGNLEADDGRRFGYQLVWFRFALSPRPIERRSAWGSNQIYMAHFAVTDAAADLFRFFERFARGAAGLAGAQAQPLQVWLEDWSLQVPDAGRVWRLQARADDETAIQLDLTPLKPVVLNGERGLSRKSAGAGNASYYYSIPRFATRGILAVSGRRYPVHGLSWLDREWGSSALAGDQQGWDWFGLQLDDGSDLMFYRLRRRDGTVDPFSGGTLIDAEGRATALQRDDVRVEVLDTWQGPRGTRYPSRWRLTILSTDLRLDIRPLIPDQLLDTSVRYWEGAVAAQGTRGGRALAGRGYVELVGY